jgi:NADPH:quinone reductase-like Zn-dependent oxidoreductase
MCVRWGLLGETARGTYAEYVVVPEQNVLALPVDFPFDQAAAASLVFLTAWHSLITRGKLQRGESILIVGAGGGVNTARADCEAYWRKGIRGWFEHGELRRAEELGADELIDRSRDVDWSKAVYSLTDKRGVDVVVDNVGQARCR